MTDQPHHAPETETPVETPEPDAAEVANPAAESAAREAAKWRKQFRQAEERATQLQTRLEALQRAEVERIAAERMADPADLWRAGVDLTDVLTDDGTVDQDSIGDTINRVLEKHRHWRKPALAAAPVTGVGTGRITTDTTDSFEDAFRPRRD